MIARTANMATTVTRNRGQETEKKKGGRGGCDDVRYAEREILQSQNNHRNREREGGGGREGDCRESNFLIELENFISQLENFSSSVSFIK